ncbi:MAG TPA: hypothetical protein PLC15_23545 [Candidatus Obscuribacter sp.]|nr:hypothetical protein [Candidatus Obscuribacter sp.]
MSFQFPGRGLFALLLVPLLSACNQQNSAQSTGISLDVKPLEKDVVYLEDRKDLAGRCKDLNFEAFTEWFYHCNVELAYDEIKKEDASGFGSCTLMIKGARVKLSCPVQVCVSKKAPADTLAHEEGHVEICRRVYAKAPEVAQKACQALMGKRFYGMGRTYEAARKQALQLAYGEIAQAFRQRVTDVAEEASDRYDRLAARREGQKEWTVKVLIETALRNTESGLGGP